MSLCIGLMSGTSADGMDACLTEISESGIRLIDALCIEYPPEVSQFFRTLALSETLSAELVMDADRLIAQYACQAVGALLQQNDLCPQQVALIGSHGHTLRHRPQPDGFSWQIGDPSWIAERTGITCIADFRRRDIAAGGEGAPLVPAFHRFALGIKPNTAVLNIGGIANLTFLDDPILGYDTGPGNALIDEWCQTITGENCDRDGDYARSGSIIPELLDTLLAHPYFSEPAPKSTGREAFNLNMCGLDLSSYPVEDVAHTLTEFSAQSICNEVIRYSKPINELLVCGGGLNNLWLIERITALLPNVDVKSTAHVGVDPEWMEAMAFAWLGWRTMNRLTGNIHEVTGAQADRILGGVYYA